MSDGGWIFNISLNQSYHSRSLPFSDGPRLPFFRALCHGPHPTPKNGKNLD